MKKIGIALFSIATFLFAIHSASALTEYKYEGWTSGNGYGTATKVDENITNIKGNAAATGGMFVGPFSKASTAKLADGISEEVYIEIDPAKIAGGELFEVSLALKNKDNEYVSEAVVMTQNVGDKVKLTAGWAKDFEAVVTAKGIYTYHWDMYIKEVEGKEKTFVKFTLLQGNREIATTEEIDFDTIVTNDTLNPIAEEEDVSVKYLWFCNVRVEEGVNVYTKLPTVNLTFVDPLGEEEDLVIPVYKYMALTEEEVKELEESTAEAAEEEGYKIEGFFTDKEFKTKFDFTKPLNDDTTLYINLAKLETEKTEELPPKTGDINLVILMGTVLLAGAGVVIASKKRFAKSN